MGISLAVLFIALAILSIALLIKSDAGEFMTNVVLWLAYGLLLVGVLWQLLRYFGG